jgi:hypothetical protein
MRHRIAVIAACLLLVAGAGGRALADAGDVLILEKGKTTYADVVQAMGEPTAEAKAEDGSRTIVYVTTKKSKPEDVVGYVGAIFSKGETTGQKKQFSFDPNGLLKSYETTTTDGGGPK